MNLSPLPKLAFLGNNGRPLVGGKLFSYEAGTTTPQATYTDASGGQQNQNPVVLDFRGEANVWLDPALTYKFILSPANDTDPPTHPIWTVDNLSAPVTLADITQQLIGELLYPVLPIEGATVANVWIAYGNILRYGTNTTPGTTDMSAAFTAALAANKLVTIPSGLYKKTISHTLNDYQIVEGDGLDNTSIVMSTDQVAFVAKAWSQIRGIKVSVSGGHTKNLIEIGSASLDGGRATLSDILVTGAGNDNIQIINGNLGLLKNVTSTLATRDNVNFAAISGDSNNWTMDGFNDLRNAGRDNLHISAGASLGDPLCSKANLLKFTAQNATRHNVYIGTRSNDITCYAEAGGTSDVTLDTYARGNYVRTVNGAVVDNSANPSFNIVENYNASGGYQRIFQNRIGFSGVASAGWQLFNDDSTAGTLACFKSAVREYAAQADGSSATQVFAFSNAVATFVLNLLTDGAFTAGAVVADAALSGKLNAYFDGSAGNGADIQDTNSTTGGTFARFLIGAVGAGSAIGSITRNAATSAVLYNTTSDERLKDITGPLADSGVLIDAIKVYDFTWKMGGSADRGVIAQEIAEVIPQAVHVPQDAKEAWGVDYSKLVPLLIAQIQELRQRIKALEP